MDYIKHFKSLECYLVSADVPFTIRPPSTATRRLKLNWIVKGVQTREHVQNAIMHSLYIHASLTANSAYHMNV